MIALALRLPGLAKRPMHGDEAVNAVKIGEDEGKGYRYDPHEYHGPTLNYFSLIPAWLGGRFIVELSEAVCGLCQLRLAWLWCCWCCRCGKRLAKGRHPVVGWVDCALTGDGFLVATSFTS